MEFRNGERSIKEASKPYHRRIEMGKCRNGIRKSRKYRKANGGGNRVNLREIDWLVAEKVMKWKLRKHFEEGCYITDEWVTDLKNKFNGSIITIDVDKFKPSTNIQDAWLVLQKADDFVINKVTEGTLGVRLRLAKIGDIHCMYNRAHAYAKTAPLAICLAALKSVGFVIGGKDN